MTHPAWPTPGILPSLDNEGATAFLERALTRPDGALAWLQRLGVEAQRVMTDNGSA